MAVKIRLARHGRKASPFYHIVAADSRSPRDGKFIEKIGTYNPMSNPVSIELKFDRALYWLEVGAQPTDTAKSILQKEGVLYMKHLLGGVKKGAFDEKEVETKFQAWINEKRNQNEAVVAKVAQDKEVALKQRIEAEAEVNKKREEEIASKNAELAAEAAAAVAAEEAAKAEAEAEAQAAASAEAEAAAPAEEAPVVEEAPVAEETPAVEEAPSEESSEEKAE